jgi:hypothetical protein
MGAARSYDDGQTASAPQNGAEADPGRDEAALSVLKKC